MHTILPSRKCSRTMTALTDAGSSNVRNAKHRERPAASRMMVQASTLPNCEKYFLSDSGNVTCIQHHNERQTTDEVYDICTICSIPVETANKHFATDMEMRQQREFASIVDI